MPGVSEAYPTTDPKKIDQWCEDERKKRGKYIEAAWRYYDGDHKKPLKVRAGQPDDNIILNISKAIVDRSVSMLLGEGIEFQIDDDSGETQRSEAELYLDLVWNGGMVFDGEKQITLNDTAVNGHVTGCPVLKLVKPTIDGELPQVVVIDPSSVVAFWAADNIKSVLWYSIYGAKDKTRQDIVKVADEAGTVTDWLIIDYEKKDRETSWTLVGSSQWGYSWPPLEVWKNLPNPNEYYGLSDLHHADVNDQINFVASNVNRILQKYAHPRTIVKGAELSSVVVDQVGGIVTVPGEAEVYNLEMQSDLNSSMVFLNELRSSYLSLNASVDMSAIVEKIGEMTNFGLSIIYKDALARIAVRRALYGGALIRVNRHLLEMGGYGADMETKIIWPDALPFSQVEKVDVAERERAMGIISKGTAARRLGIDWDQEQQLIGEEGQGADIGTQILNNLAFNRGQNANP